MDIHPPHAIHSWKDLLVQLGTITAGVLIALSLEGVRETIRDSRLPEEARRLATAAAVIGPAGSEVHQLELGLNFPTLSNASWQTAERTGAFAHMDYAEVQRYADLYSFQDFMSTQHRQAIDALAASIGILAASEGGDPTNAPPAEVERFRQQVVALKSILFVEEQMTRTASERYKKALE